MNINAALTSLGLSDDDLAFLVDEVLGTYCSRAEEEEYAIRLWFEETPEMSCIEVEQHYEILFASQRDRERTERILEALAERLSLL